MSLKSLSKTRWRIEPDRVTIYPYGVFYVFTAIIAVIFTGLLLVYIKYQNATLTESLPLVLFFLLMVLVFWAFAGTYIEFDNSRGRMRKMLFGFLPTTTNTIGSYNYRLFKKGGRYGKGIIVSSSYTKNDDQNAIGFVAEAVQVIHGYLDIYDTPADYASEPITSYRFFNQQGGTYTIKTKKIGALVFGLIFLVIGLYLLTIETNSIMAKFFIVVVTVFLALIFFNAAYTVITFDPAAQTIQRTGIVKFFNRRYHFGAFAGIQTLRRSINFVYAGTDVNMYMDVPDKNGKQDIFTVISLKKSSDIERFIKELYQIMEI
jgi:hypothetical protein